MGFIEIEKWPTAKIVGTVGLAFTASVTVPYLPTITFSDGKAEFSKKAHHLRHPIHAPGTSLVTGTDSTTPWDLFKAVPDHLEYTPGAITDRLAVNIGTLGQGAIFEVSTSDQRPLVSFSARLA